MRSTALLLLYLFCVCLLINSCQKENPVILPTVTTKPIDSITNTTAVSGGVISNDGGAKVVARGVCWDTSEDPTVELETKTIDGNGAGDFASKLTGLTRNKKYYVRAYATNRVGTNYGDQLEFTSFNATPINGSAFPDNTDFIKMNGGNVPLLDSALSGSHYYHKGGMYWGTTTWGITTPWSIKVSFQPVPSVLQTWIIYIPEDVPPKVSGTYVLQEDYTTLTPGTACIGYVRYSDGYLYIYYFSISGQLQIDVINGQVSATFSNVILKPQESGSLATLSGHITCH